MDVDIEKAKAKGVNINDTYNTINATFGSFYVNDFSLYGRTYKVNMQAIDTYRSNAEDMQYIYVKSSNGELLPLDSFVTLKQIVGADIIERFNLFQAAKVSGQDPGHHLWPRQVRLSTARHRAHGRLAAEAWG